MPSTSLVILAAGLASRFGGNKQITAVDDNGHLIIDYSLFDAKTAGFEKVVFVIQPQMRDSFHEAIGKRTSKHMSVAYAFQTLDRFLPDDISIPDQRIKPWGTGHALLCAKDEIDSPFAVINADDFYGRSAFQNIFDFLAHTADDQHHAMVGYRVENTLSETGSVSRGICKTTPDHYLSEIRERRAITPWENAARFTENNGLSYTVLPAGTLVSMNLWGFGKGFMSDLERYFSPFLRDNLNADPLKCEYFLPYVPQKLLENKSASIKVISTDEKWYGVTYSQDLDNVKKAITNMIASGKYPDRLLD